MVTLQQSINFSDLTCESSFLTCQSYPVCESYNIKPKVLNLESAPSASYKVYLRLKPNEQENKTHLIINSTTLLTQVPKESASYHIASTGNGQPNKKFKFTSILDESRSQSDTFQTCILKPLKLFLEGENGTIMAYGSTCAGKTYTMHGTTGAPGMIPRAIHYIFTALAGRIEETGRFQPYQNSKIVQLNDNLFNLESKLKNLILSWDINRHLKAIDMSSISCRSFGSESFESAAFREMTRCMDLDVDEFDMGSTYGVWISMVQIYNEIVKDLLVFPSEREGFTRLMVGQDDRGNFFVKNARMIHVKNGDEAYQVSQFGRLNLHRAATALNDKSSRSHCIFTITIVRHGSEMSLRRFSFVDLAGSERVKKTQNVGTRLEESKSINKSLSTLGKCLDILKKNQHAKVASVVPVRDSNVTKLFKSALLGEEKLTIIINISTDHNLFDETLHVLKFSALAQEIVPVQNKTFLRPATRFSMLVQQDQLTTWASASSSLDSLYDGKNELLEKIATLEVHLENKEEQLANVEGELESLRGILKKKKDELKNLRSKLFAHCTKQMEKSSESRPEDLFKISELENMLAESRRNAEKQQQKLFRYKDKLAEHEGQSRLINKLKKELDEKNQIIQEAISDYKVLVEENEAMKAVNLDLYEENRKLLLVLDDLTEGQGTITSVTVAETERGIEETPTEMREGATVSTITPPTSSPIQTVALEVDPMQSNCDSNSSEANIKSFTNTSAATVHHHLPSPCDNNSTLRKSERETLLLKEADGDTCDTGLFASGNEEFCHHASKIDETKSNQMKLDVEMAGDTANKVETTNVILTPIFTLKQEHFSPLIHRTFSAVESTYEIKSEKRSVYKLRELIPGTSVKNDGSISNVCSFKTISCDNLNINAVDEHGESACMENITDKSQINCSSRMEGIDKEGEEENSDAENYFDATENQGIEKVSLSKADITAAHSPREGILNEAIFVESNKGNDDVDSSSGSRGRQEVSRKISLESEKVAEGIFIEDSTHSLTEKSSDCLADCIRGKSFADILPVLPIVCSSKVQKKLYDGTSASEPSLVDEPESLTMINGDDHTEIIVDDSSPLKSINELSNPLLKLCFRSGDEDFKESPLVVEPMTEELSLGMEKLRITNGYNQNEILKSCNNGLSKIQMEDGSLEKELSNDRTALDNCDHFPDDEHNSNNPDERKNELSKHVDQSLTNDLNDLLANIKPTFPTLEATGPGLESSDLNVQCKNEKQSPKVHGSLKVDVMPSPFSPTCIAISGEVLCDNTSTMQPSDHISFGQELSKNMNVEGQRKNHQPLENVLNKSQVDGMPLSLRQTCIAICGEELGNNTTTMQRMEHFAFGSEVSRGMNSESPSKDHPNSENILSESRVDSMPLSLSLRKTCKALSNNTSTMQPREHLSFGQELSKNMNIEGQNKNHPPLENVLNKTRVDGMPLSLRQTCIAICGEELGNNTTTMEHFSFGLEMSRGMNIESPSKDHLNSENILSESQVDDMPLSLRKTKKARIRKNEVLNIATTVDQCVIKLILDDPYQSKELNEDESSYDSEKNSLKNDDANDEYAAVMPKSSRKTRSKRKKGKKVEENDCLEINSKTETEDNGSPKMGNVGIFKRCDIENEDPAVNIPLSARKTRTGRKRDPRDHPALSKVRGKKECSTENAPLPPSAKKKVFTDGDFLDFEEEKMEDDVFQPRRTLRTRRKL